MKTAKSQLRSWACVAAIAAATLPSLTSAGEGEIVYDAEFSYLKAQHADVWQAQDSEVAAKLADIRAQNGDMPPNIIYILIDDVGFGEFGVPELNFVRGYQTPSLNQLSEESMSFARMYSEPSCTPTRAAFLTGRLPVRSHMLEPKIVPPEGSGLNADEVTIAEVLSEVGYNTSHIGKWHQGDIEQGYPHNQGFDYASFAMHNQAAYGLMTSDAEAQKWAFGVTPDVNDAGYVLDKTFRPNGWIMAVEAEKGGTASEWGIEAGETAGYAHYDAMNDRFQEQAMEQLRVLAEKHEPFFLNYWPMKPVDFNRAGLELKTENRGSWVESMQVLDGWIGDILTDVDRLGIADNTIVIAMGDNGAMGQGMPYTGFSDMVYRGFKGETTEGGIRVNAFMRWPAAIKAGSTVGDMIHVSDLYTTLANVAGAKGSIPTDRVIDGIDQTHLILEGDGNGRRDYLHVYAGKTLSATIKEQFKVHWPAPGTAGFKLPIYNLLHDPREEHPLKTQGMWTVAFFEDMLHRHLALKKAYPNREETLGESYAGIDNLRPETLQLLENAALAKSFSSHD
ncbi:sulfatase-like hydrolase/transferase [Shimia sp.]|uniref:sulfatase-like hydrolase/transferase n=1 Tax=Shimia sp. TaxID=1954381 RepID=UPI00329A73AE